MQKKMYVNTKQITMLIMTNISRQNFNEFYASAPVSV